MSCNLISVSISSTPSGRRCSPEAAILPARVSSSGSTPSRRYASSTACTSDPSTTALEGSGLGASVHFSMNHLRLHMENVLN